MDSAYALEYRRLHEQHWWWRVRQHDVLAMLRKLHPCRRQARILDVGCGDGLMFDELAQFGDVEGVEVDATIVSEKNRWRDQIFICPFDSSFQPGRKYDTILMLDVLEHLPDPRGALQHALSLLTTNGSLLITVPAFRFLWTTHDDLNHHFTRYDRRTFRQLAEGLGTIRTMRYTFHWLFLAKLAVRAKEAVFHSQPRSPRIPPGAVNRTLYALTRMEQSILGPFHVPFGGSMMAVVGK